MLTSVIPLYNEQESILVFYNELVKEMEKLKMPYEIIFIDDGSVDDSLNMLKQVAEKDKNVRIFSFRKNKGKAEALSLGFAKARGEYIVTLDADLQDRPSEIAPLLEKAKDGYDFVSGWRKNRKDSISTLISSKIFNKLVGKIWGLQLHDYNCGLKLFTQDAAKSIRLYGGLHRFIPILVYNQGFAVSEVAVAHDPRKFGRSKYGFSKIWKDIPDMFTMFFLIKYSDRPFHFFGFVGFTLLVCGILILSHLSILHFQGETIGGRPLLFFGMLLVLSGFQVFFTGFLADLIINITHNTQRSHAEEKDILKYSTD